MITSVELRPLDTQDRCAFAGASDEALINVDHDFAVLVDKADDIMEAAYKVEVVGVHDDGEPVTYMIMMEDRESAIRLATGILHILDIVGYDPHTILRAMVVEGFRGSMIL